MLAGRPQIIFLRILEETEESQLRIQIVALKSQNTPTKSVEQLP